MKFFRKIGSFFLDLVETVVMAMAVFVIIYLFLFQPHQVRGNSMYPNFHDGEYILTDKITYRLKNPQRGDIIIFQAPQNKENDYIKRIVGLPGDNLKIESGRIFINNNLLEEYYLPSDFLTQGGNFFKVGENVIIPEGQYFVLGDNRSHSSDSREWGLVPKANIVGKAWLRYWPANQFGIIPEVEPQTISP